jgi:hypothetical protein
MSELNLRDVQLKLPAIKHKYAGRLIRAKIDLQELFNRRRQVKQMTVDKLKKEAPYELSDPVADKMADKYDGVQEIGDMINEHKLLIELLEKAEKIFNSMTFDIKNMIEIMKLEVE